MAAFLTFAFDTVAPKFYSKSDAERGYMILKGDGEAGMRANFVTVLIGGIIDNYKLITNVDILLERLYSIKEISRVPSGSNYAIDAIETYGAFKGGIMAFKRILRCNPFGTSGYDPVVKEAKHEENL